MKHIQYVPQYQRDTLNQRKTVLATLLEPEILILDEATTNLDVINEEAILQMLISLKMTHLIIISHDTYVLSQFEGIQLQLNKLNN